MSEPWFKFYPTDWRSDPKLRMCSLGARGLWIEMISIMHEATPYGHLLVSGLSPTDAQLAVLVGAPVDQIPALRGELEATGVFSRTREGVIYSRRMTRSAKKAAIARKNGKSGGNPTLGKQKGNPPLDNQNPTNGVKPQKPEARYQIPETASQLGGARDFEGITDKLLKAAGLDDARSHRNPALINLAPVLGLLDAGFDLDRHILPTIAQKAAGGFVFRSWSLLPDMVREFSEKRDAAKAGAPPPRPQDWSKRIEQWRIDGYWPYSLGPAPGEPGCQVPPEFLEEAA